LVQLDQRGRQDGRHIQILIRVLPSYLADLRASVAGGRMEERQFLKFLERLLAIVTSEPGRRTFAGIGIDPKILFDGIEPAGLPKLEGFLMRRRPRVLP
jgi:hypothetical protein